MEARRKVYKQLPDVLKMPKEFQHRRVEVILLPLDEETPTRATVKAKQSKLVRFAGAWAGEPMVREEGGKYGVREPEVA